MQNIVQTPEDLIVKSKYDSSSSDIVQSDAEENSIEELNVVRSTLPYTSFNCLSIII